MTDLRKAAEMALKTLENNRLRTDEHIIPIVADEQRQALAQGEQELVAYIDHVSGKPKLIDGYVVQTDYDIPLYIAPPKREWVGLHLDDMPEIYVGDKSFLEGAKWAEVKLKEKNT